MLQPTLGASLLILGYALARRWGLPLPSPFTLIRLALTKPLRLLPLNVFTHAIHHRLSPSTTPRFKPFTIQLPRDHKLHIDSIVACVEKCNENSYPPNITILGAYESPGCPTIPLVATRQRAEKRHDTGAQHKWNLCGTQLERTCYGEIEDAINLRNRSFQHGAVVHELLNEHPQIKPLIEGT